MNLALHSTGASFIAHQSQDNPRDVIVSLLRRNPDDDRQFLFAAFCEETGVDTKNGYLRAMAWYFFVNMHAQITDPRATNAHVARKERRAEGREFEASLVDRIKTQIFMLDFLMPIGDGKPMRDCTGSEMARLGNRYAKIAERVGKTKTVGSVLSEEQVRALMK